MKVVSCGEMFTVRSEKAEGGSLNKRNLVLQEIGGKYENQYAVTALGNLAQSVFYPGEYVWAALRFQTREYNGQVFQDITATDIITISIVSVIDRRSCTPLTSNDGRNDGTEPNSTTSTTPVRKANTEYFARLS